MESAKNKKNIRGAEAKEKQPNADRMKIPPPHNTTTKDPLLDPSQNAEADPEILPEAENKTDKVPLRRPLRGKYPGGGPRRGLT